MRSYGWEEGVESMFKSRPVVDNVRLQIASGLSEGVILK